MFSLLIKDPEEQGWFRSGEGTFWRTLANLQQLLQPLLLLLLLSSDSVQVCLKLPGLQLQSLVPTGSRSQSEGWGWWGRTRDLQDLLFDLVHAPLLQLQLIAEATQLSVVDLPVVLHLFLQGSLRSRGRNVVSA